MSSGWVFLYIIQWVVICLTLVIVYQLMKMLGKYIRLAEKNTNSNDIGLKLGSKVPPMKFKNGRFYKGTFFPKSHLLIFLSTGCKFCEDLLNDIAEGKHMIHKKPLVLINNTNDKLLTDYREILNKLNLPHEVLTEDIKRDYETPGYPFIIVIDDKGTAINKGVANNVEGLNSIIIKEPMLKDA